MEHKRVRIPTRPHAKIHSPQWMIRYLLVCLAANGCAGRAASPGVESSLIPTSTAPAGETSAILPPPHGTGPTSWTTGASPKTREAGPDAEPAELADHVEGGSPPGLLTEATDVLEGRVVSIWPVGDGSKRLFDVDTDRGDCGIFMEEDGRYIRVNRGTDLIVINESLRKSRFTRYHFDNPNMVDELLWTVISLHTGHGSLRLIPSSSPAMSRPSDWLHGTERNEAVFRELSREPEPTFKGNKWTVVFNVFKSDGSVDCWRLVGRHDPKANVNEILQIDTKPLKPPSTFSFGETGGTNPFKVINDAGDRHRRENPQ
jgi:hypothetical protein